MRQVIPAQAGQLRDPIEALVQLHGGWRVLAAAALALLRRPPPLVDARRLNPHLRRDIGLPPWPSDRD